MIAMLVVVSLTALTTAVIVNFVITVARDHQRRGCTSPIETVLRDATDVSLSVREFTRQLGGQA